MKSMSAKEAKNSFGLLLDCARAKPIEVQKHGRPIVIVLSVEEFQRLRNEFDNIYDTTQRAGISK